MSYTFESGGNPNYAAPREPHGLTRVTASAVEPRRRPAGKRGGDPRQHRHPAVQRLSGRRRLHRAPTAARTRSARCTSPATGRSSSASATAPTAIADPLSLRAQDLDSPNGKILRINTDGSAPSDNPFYDGTNSWRSRVWLLRRPQSLRVHAAARDRRDLLRRRRLEHLGGGRPRTRRARTSAGPATRATGPSSTYRRALRAVRAARPAAVDSAVLHLRPQQRIGGDRRPVLHRHALSASSTADNFFFADYSGNFIKRVVFDASTGPVSAAAVRDRRRRARSSLDHGPGRDALLPVVHDRRDPTDPIQRPVAEAAATPTYGYSPLTVSFSSAGSNNAGGGSLDLPVGLRRRHDLDRRPIRRIPTRRRRVQDLHGSSSR